MKSPEILLNEALEALGKVGKRKTFDEKRKAGSPIEVQLNLAETILKESKVTRDFTSSHNSGVEQEEIRESAFSEGYDFKGDPRELQVRSYVAMGCTEADARKTLGLPPKEIAEAGRNAVADYFLAKSTGFNEADAIRFAKKGRSRHY